MLSEPLSFWGGYDPTTGTIIDQRHAQAGCVVGGRVLVVPRSRGSAGTPAGIAESIRLGVGPAGIVLGKSDINIAIGTMTAAQLYDIHVPVIVVDPITYNTFKDDQIITIQEDGSILR